MNRRQIQAPQLGLEEMVDARLTDGAGEMLASQDASLANLAVFIPIVNLAVDPQNPRKTLREKALRELVASIRATGLKQPLEVRPMAGKGNEGRFWILDGQRRFEACKRIGMEQILCVINPRVSATDTVRARIEALIANLQREDVPPLELARSLRELKSSQEDLTWDEIGALIGKSGAYLRGMAQLGENLQQEIMDVCARNPDTLAARDLMFLQGKLRHEQIFYGSLMSGRVLADRVEGLEAYKKGDVWKDPDNGKPWTMEDCRKHYNARQEEMARNRQLWEQSREGAAPPAPTLRPQRPTQPTVKELLKTIDFSKAKDPKAAQQALTDQFREDIAKGMRLAEKAKALLEDRAFQLLMQGDGFVTDKTEDERRETELLKRLFLSDEQFEQVAQAERARAAAADADTQREVTDAALRSGSVVLHGEGGYGKSSLLGGFAARFVEEGAPDDEVTFLVEAGERETHVAFVPTHPDPPAVVVGDSGLETHRETPGGGMVRAAREPVVTPQGRVSGPVGAAPSAPRSHVLTLQGFLGDVERLSQRLFDWSQEACFQGTGAERQVNPQLLTAEEQELITRLYGKVGHLQQFVGRIHLPAADQERQAQPIEPF